MTKEKEQDISENLKSSKNLRKSDKNESEERKILEKISFSKILQKKPDGLTPEDISDGSIFSDVCNVCISDYDFWDKYEKALLEFVLSVTVSDDTIPDNKRTLNRTLSILRSNSLEQLKKKVSESHFCKQIMSYWDTFCTISDQVQESIFTGLSIKLGLLKKYSANGFQTMQIKDKSKENE